MTPIQQQARELVERFGKQQAIMRCQNGVDKFADWATHCEFHDGLAKQYTAKSDDYKALLAEVERV